ncbi:unnamed protein product, partial [Iphiclides podalirius]
MGSGISGSCIGVRRINADTTREQLLDTGAHAVTVKQGRRRGLIEFAITCRLQSAERLHPACICRSLRFVGE